MAQSRYNTILKIAEDSGGVVSARNARGAGITPVSLVKMAQRGRLLRLARGVYGIPSFPRAASQFAQYQEALAWANAGNGPTASISHETALAVYRLSDASPAKIHLTISKKVRLRRVVPELYVVHRGDLLDADITDYEGLRITTVPRTILDVAAAGRRDLALGAIEDAIRNGWIDAVIARQLRKRVHA